MRGFKGCLLLLPIFPSIMAVAIAGARPAAAQVTGAEAAVADAEEAVRHAEAERALWTSAEDAMRKARRALRDGDTMQALRQARIAREQSELGIAQKSYPPFR